MKNKKLCIVVPYRDREAHLSQFLPAMDEYLTMQNIDYIISIIEQQPGTAFNRAKLLNVGFDFTKTSNEGSPYDYYCFHDVDMLPEESDYDYCDIPTHLAGRAQQFGYRLPYPGYFGGVTIFDRESFVKINGYSNDYWGWGAEDDDAFNRCTIMGIAPRRKDGKYRSLDHTRHIDQIEYHKNVDRLRSMTNFYDGNKFTEGLSTLDYEVLDTHISERYIHIKVKI